MCWKNTEGKSQHKPSFKWGKNTSWKLKILCKQTESRNRLLWKKNNRTEQQTVQPHRRRGWDGWNSQDLMTTEKMRSHPDMASICSRQWHPPPPCHTGNQRKLTSETNKWGEKGVWLRKGTEILQQSAGESSVWKIWKIIHKSDINQLRSFWKSKYIDKPEVITTL